MAHRPILAALVVGLLLAAGPAPAADPLVISMWGGNWKDTVEKVIAKPFTAKTGIPVEFEVGGTLDRLAKARVAKTAPLVDITFTTVKVDITKWADLWDPQLKGKVGMPDFDPSHIITISALLEGGDERSWQKGQERLKRLKPNIAAFFSTDARSQDLMKTGEAPVQVMLSINAFHLIEQGLPVKVVNPTDRPGIVGIDTMAIMAGTKKSDAAHQFIDLALSREIQEQLVLTFKAGPTNLKAAVPAKLRGQPGVFTTPAEWKERGYIMDDETRAKTLPAWKEWFNATIVAK